MIRYHRLKFNFLSLFRVTYQATALCLQASYIEKYEYASAVIKIKKCVFTVS